MGTPGLDKRYVRVIWAETTHHLELHEINGEADLTT